ncbi:divalent-cation tolerance protein CutA [Vibrio sp.]|uniref:divalent-cation tolerance protein CutA n=1 Tax=Vibrio sp. TaxID=678 RepID=UPI003D0C144D
MSNKSFCIVLTTTNRPENAQLMVQSLLSKHLSACIQTLPIQSHYRWNNEICCDDEILLIIKTRIACYPALEEEIIRLHCYQIPEIIQLPISEGFDPYLSWLNQHTQINEQ